MALAPGGRLDPDGWCCIYGRNHAIMIVSGFLENVKRVSFPDRSDQRLNSEHLDHLLQAIRQNVTGAVDARRS
jgi:hypothetical protein